MIDQDWPRSDIAKKQIYEFIAALRDKDFDVRVFAAKTLGKIGDSRGLEPLLAALRDENYDVKRSATEALAKLGNLAVKPLILALKDRPTESDRIVEALGKIGDVRSVEPLISALKNKI